MNNENLKMYKSDNSGKQFKNLNDYFTKYSSTKDIKYYYEFLSVYENTLNTKALRYISTNNLEESRLEDLKQIFATLVWTEMQDYSPDSDIPFLQIIKHKLLKEWNKYIRICCSSVIIDTENGYRDYKATIKLFNKLPDNLSITEKTESIADTLNKTKDVIMRFLEYHNNKNSVSIVFEDEQESGTISEETLSHDNLSAEAQFFHNEKMNQIKTVLADLSPKDKKIIELTSGICLNCFGKIEKKTYQQTSLLLGMTESAVEKRRKKILDKIKSDFSLQY